MDLKKEVEKNIQQIFKQASSLVKTGIYKELTEISRENYQANPVYSSTSITCLVVEYKKYEIEFARGSISTEDRKILIPLKGLSVIFQVGNLIEIDETEYTIKNVSIDPTGTLSTCQARK